MKNKVEITKGLESDLKKYLEQYCVGMATFVRDDLTQEARVSILDFYADYTPKIYNRHEENFQKHSFEKYYKNPHGQIVRGGVKLSTEDMAPVYQDPLYEVFDIVYAGFHGPSSAIKGNPPRMVPSPMERILDRQSYLIGNIGSFKSYGEDRANKGSYEYI